MPYHIQMVDQILRLTYTGYVTQVEIFESANAIHAMEKELAYRPDQLTDLSGITKRETNFNTLSTVATERRVKVFPNSFRIAMFAPTPESFGFARMFQTIVDNSQIDIQIFTTLAEAEAWLASKK